MHTRKEATLTFLVSLLIAGCSPQEEAADLEESLAAIEPVPFPAFDGLPRRQEA